MPFESIEEIRSRYRPSRILTLFVGESAPVSGAFFYSGNTVLTSYMKQAMDAAGLKADKDFLARFKSYGWFLDDLVLTPVNHLKGIARRRHCLDAQHSLQTRIVEYRPQAIVSMMLTIDDIVTEAAKAAGSDAPRFAVPFAGNGQQLRFLKRMAEIIPKLPRAIVDN